MTVAGLVLAAGAGTRWGSPKALARDPDGTSWLARATRVLSEGGCTEVTVLLGAGGGEAAALVPDVPTEVVPDWADGLHATLAHGLRRCLAGDAVAVAIQLVDLPDVTTDVVRRLLDPPAEAATLRRAAFSGRPGHPVVIGRAHWPALLEDLATAGDRGAGRYLAAHDAALVECGDLASGRDRDVRGSGS